jgi:hypothetical protein
MTSATTKMKKSTFEDRCTSGNGTMFSQINGLKTMNEVIDFVAKHPEVKVQINTTGHTPMYLAETTLPQDRLCVPFMWAFLLGKSPSTYNMAVWSDITHFVPSWKSLSGTSHKNVLMVIKNAKTYSSINVCTFPEFLSSEYSRTCRSAFEGLRNTMKLIIPNDDPIAFGIGTCVKDEKDTLYKDVHLKIDGIDVIITKLK